MLESLGGPAALEDENCHSEGCSSGENQGICHLRGPRLTAAAEGRMLVSMHTADAGLDSEPWLLWWNPEPRVVPLPSGSAPCPPM